MKKLLLTIFITTALTTIPAQAADIHDAAQAGDNAEIEKLLKKGVDVNARDKNGETPLYEAATNGYTEIVELLISKGADVNAKDNDGITALHLSAWNNNSEMVAILIAKGADVNIKKNDGNTPLHDAASNNSKTAIKLLLLNGADINIKNNEGQTPAMLTDDAETKQMLTKATTGAEKSVDKAKSAYQSGDYDNAIKYATKAIENNEGWMSYLVRGWSYRSTGKFQKAVDDFNVVINNTANSDGVVAFALSDRGLVYITYGTTLFDSDKDKGVDLVKQGVADYREAIAKDNTAITPAYRFADFSIVLKQYQDARDVLDNLIAHNPAAKDDAEIKALQAEINKNL